MAHQLIINLFVIVICFVHLFSDDSSTFLVDLVSHVVAFSSLVNFVSFLSFPSVTFIPSTFFSYVTLFRKYSL